MFIHRLSPHLDEVILMADTHFGSPYGARPITLLA